MKNHNSNYINQKHLESLNLQTENCKKNYASSYFVPNKGRYKHYYKSTYLKIKMKQGSRRFRHLKDEEVSFNMRKKLTRYY